MKLMRKYGYLLAPPLTYLGILIVLAIIMSLLAGNGTVTSFGWAMLFLGMLVLAVTMFSLLSDVDVVGLNRSINYRIAVSVTGVEDGEKADQLVKRKPALGFFGNGLIVSILALLIGGIIVFA